jgi:hypothetical protein
VTQSVQLQDAYSRPWVFLSKDGTRKCGHLALKAASLVARVGDGVAGKHALGFLGFFAWLECRIWGEKLGMADRVRTQNAIDPGESGMNVRVSLVVKGPGIPETPTAGLASAVSVPVTPEVTPVHFRSSCHC